MLQVTELLALGLFLAAFGVSIAASSRAKTVAQDFISYVWILISSMGLAFGLVHFVK